VLADDSVWNVGIFGWWYTGTVSLVVVAVLSAIVGRLLDKRNMERVNGGEQRLRD
jgi:hypothetical protein